MKTVYSITKREVSEQELQDQKLFNVFVFGLPRSGTSLMTHICELLGVKMVHTTEEKPIEYKKFEGTGYHPNPKGFYEVTEDIMGHYLDIIGTPYSGCKMIIPVTSYRMDVVKKSNAKVIMMWRDPEEIKQSQEAFYSRESDKAYLRTALVTQEQELKDQKIDYLKVNYRDVIQKPEETVLAVKAFIGSDKPIHPCLDFIDPKLYRFNKDILIQTNG